MKHDFIEANRHLYGVKLLCHTLQVSRSGFYAARHRQPSARRQRQTMLTNQISAIHSASRDTYGAPRIMLSSPPKVLLAATIRWPS
jgi:putative transposase